MDGGFVEMRDVFLEVDHRHQTRQSSNNFLALISLFSFQFRLSFSFLSFSIVTLQAEKKEERAEEENEEKAK